MLLTQERLFPANSYAAVVAPLKETVAARLQQSSYSEVRHVRCDFHEGAITLRGKVSCYYFKQIAQTIVVQMEQVGLIVNRIEVADPAARLD